MAKRLLPEIHPGEILLEDFMKPMGVSARQLAADIDVSPSRISELVNGQRPITADTALRLGLFFSMEPRFWLNLQAEYDMRTAERELQHPCQPHREDRGSPQAAARPRAGTIALATREGVPAPRPWVEPRGSAASKCSSATAAA